jgi:hypothetical protein
LNAGSSNQAVAKWRKALKRSPDSLEALVGLADSLSVAGG